MLNGLSPARGRLFTLTGALLAVLLVAFVAVLAARRIGGTSFADQRVPGPVIVVPGYGGNISSLDPLVTELRREGRDVVVFRPTAGGTGDLRVQAQRLGELARSTMRRTDDSSVDVVGYSAGGVVARLFVRDDGGAGVVRRVLTLGSPHHGTDVAQLAEGAVGSCPKACEQLGPDSDLIRQLNAGDETPAGPRWVTLRSSSDQVVTPTASASLAGALDLLVQDVCPGGTTSHHELPGNPVVLATLRSALGPGAPAAPAKVSC
ncbi:MAG: lipase family alpha/beta hydrolase [Marmoricola sp.]